MHTAPHADHIVELRPIHRCVARAVITAQSATFPNKAQQALANSRINENHAYGVVEIHGIEIFDFRVLQIVQVIAEYGFVSTGFLAHLFDRKVFGRNRAMSPVRDIDVEHEELTGLLWLCGRFLWQRSFDVLAVFGG